jgi:hypothetical protein
MKFGSVQNVVQLAANPGSPANGDLWYNTTTGKFMGRENGANTVLSSPGGGIGSRSLTIPEPLVNDTVPLHLISGGTITQVNDHVAGSSSPSVSYELRYASDPSAAGTAVFASARAVNSTTGSVTTTFSNATIPANNYVWLRVTAVAGTVTRFHVTLHF